MTTIDENWNVVDVTRAFCQHVLPLVYDESLSYKEMVCKMSYKLNMVIENNNNLPAYIKEEITQLFNDYINSDEFNEMVRNYIMENFNYIGVHWYGAKGDGETDDTESIQKIINDFNGFTIFLQKGRYKISSTILLPNNTIIKGCGINSEIFSVQDIDLIKTEKYDEFIQQQPPINICSIHLENFAINGLYFSDTENRVKSGKQTGSGLKIYGNSFTLKNLTIFNMPENGLVLRNVNNITANPTPQYFYEQIIDSCKVTMCGKDCVNTMNIYDYVVANCSINTAGQRNDGDDYANLRIITGNCKMSNSHLSSLYGNVYPKYSLYIGSNSGNNEIVNSHIEGAFLPLCCNGNNVYISNSSIYATVGEYLIELAANLANFENVFLGTQGAAPITQPPFKCAFNYVNNPRGNRINVVLQGCKLDVDNTNLGYLNEFIVKGFCNDGAITTPDLSKADYQLSGDFVPIITTKNNRHTFYFDGFPSVQFPSLIAITEDTTISSNFIYIGHYGSGTLNLEYSITRGNILVIINNTAQEIPFTSNISINGLNQGTIKPHYNVMLIAVDSTTAVGNID